MFNLLGGEVARIRDSSLNADGRVVRTLQILVGSLSGVGGFAEQSAEYMETSPTMLERSLRLGIAEPLESLDDFWVRWAQVLDMIAEFSLCASTIAGSVRAAISSLPVEDQAPKLRAFCKDFMQSFEDSATELGVGRLFAHPEAEHLYEARFLRACQQLPDMTEETSAQDEEWPFIRRAEPGQVSFGRVPEALLPVVSQKVSFAFALLPFLGRILAYKNFVTVSGAMYNLRRYFRQVHDGTPEEQGTTFEQVSVALNEYVAPSVCLDGGESNALRQLKRSVTHAALLTALVKGLQQATSAFLEDNATLPRTVFTVEKYHGIRPDAGQALVDYCRQVFIHVDAEEWNLGPINLGGPAPGALTQAPSATTTQTPIVAAPPTPSQTQATTRSGNLPQMGMSFLNEQLRDRESKYRMPSKQASQRIWEDWFLRIAALKRLYPGISDRLIIPALLGHIGAEDGRILGWQEAYQESLVAGEELSLDEFLAHVRKQVLPAGTARKTAATELEILTAKPYVLEDCQALRTKLQQLFRQLYPVNSEESEPITRLRAMRQVHLGIEILGSSVAKSKVVKAWRAYTAYNHSAFFMKYIEESLHDSTQKSMSLCTEYLQSLCEHLDAAHTMQVQLSQGQSVQTNVRVETNVRHQSAAVTFSPSTGAGPSRRDRGASRAPRRERSQSTGRQGQSKRPKKAPREPSRARGAAPPPPPPSSAQQQTERRLDAVYAALGPEYQPGRIRTLFEPPLPQMTRAEVLREIAAGACILCQQHGHMISHCPCFGAAEGALRDACRSYKRAYLGSLAPK
jgi:hypothetical protein